MIITPSQYSRGNGFEVVPSPPQLGVNLFQGDTEENAKLSRDAYFTGNPTELARYDANALRMIQVSWTDPTAAFEFESRVAGDWVNTFTQTVEEFQLSTHSVTELNDVTSAGSGQIITVDERIKLTGIQDNATANQTDSYLLDRTNHTGTQTIATIDNLQTTLDGKAANGHTHQLTVSGDVTGSATLGQSTVNLVATVQDNSHNHTIANVTGLQTTIDGKQNKINGLSVHRFIQVSNGVNSTITSNNINTTTILPLLGNGTFNGAFNNPTGYGSLDVANNWIDIRNLNENANFICRITMSNNQGGNVDNATMVLRLIPDINNPAVFTDILNVPETFGTQAAFMSMAFSGGVDAIRIGIRTSSTENVRLIGVYLVMTDPIIFP